MPITKMFDTEVELTEAQKEALKRLDLRWAQVHYWKGDFGLPTGYLSVRLFYSNGDSIYGGISPEGDVST